MPIEFQLLGVLLVVGGTVAIVIPPVTVGTTLAVPVVLGIVLIVSGVANSAALMKSPGPFYQYPDGHFQPDTDNFDESAYLTTLREIDIYEARGRIDFSVMARRCKEVLLSG